MIVDTDDLITAREIGVMLDVGIAAIHNYRSRYPDFPKPVVQKDRSTLWNRPEIEEWIAKPRMTTKAVAKALAAMPRYIEVDNGDDSLVTLCVACRRVVVDTSLHDLEAHPDG